MNPTGEGSQVVQGSIVALIRYVEVAQRIKREALGTAQAVSAYGAASMRGEAAALPEDQVGGGIARKSRRTGMASAGERREVFQHPVVRLAFIRVDRIGDVQIA
jgi:hypothetical protein